MPKDEDALRDLGSHTFRSGVAALLVRAAQSILWLIAMIVFARLLAPRDFGVFAMVVPLVLLVNSLTNQGFQTTLIQAKALSHGETSRFFGFAIRVNTLLVAGSIAVAFLLAWFYQEPNVVPLVAVWATALLLLTRTSFQEALLKREMRFPIVLGIQLAGLSLGLVAGIVAALLGAGYWALVIQALVMEGARAAAVHRVSRWRPGRSADGDAAAPITGLKSFWRFLVGFRLATWLSEQPDRLLVGRLGGAATLGFYDTARRWSMYPFSEPFLSLSDVAVASLSAVSRNPEQYRRFLSREVRAMLTIALPPIAFTAVESETVVRVLLGSQWDDAVPYLRLLCIAAFFGSFARLTQWVFFSLGDTQRQLRWSLIIQTPVLLAGVLIGSLGGATGVAIGYTASTVALALPTVAYGLHSTPVTTRDFLRAAARPAVAALAGLVALVLAHSFLPTAIGSARLAAALVIYAPVVILAWIALPGGRAAALELIAAARDLLKGAPS